MIRKDRIHAIVIIIIIIFFAANINGINSFLSFHTDKTIEFGHSQTTVPEAWNTTQELNQVNLSKTPDAITNGYIFIDHWDDWPEDHITSISEAKFSEMENGNYKVLKNENTTINGVPVSKQYFTNPTRNTNETWNHIGVNYVFAREDTNYCIQVHYFTTHDYENESFTKEVDERIEDDMANLHNNDYNGFFSGLRDIYNFIISRT